MPDETDEALRYSAGQAPNNPAADGAQSSPFQDAMLKSAREQQDIIRSSIERQDKLQAERRAEEAPLRRRLTEEMDRPFPEPPPVREPPPPPKFNFRKEANEFLGIAGMIALVAGAAGRQHSINALSAFSGAVTGLREGQQERFDQAYKTWNAELTALKEKVGEEARRYRQIFENRKLGVEEKRAQLQLVASEYQNQTMYEQARTNDILRAAQVYQQMVGQLERLDDSRKRFDEEKRAHDETQRHHIEEEALQRGRYSGSVMSPEAISLLVDEWQATGRAPAGWRLGFGPGSNQNRKAFQEEAVRRGVTGERIRQAMIGMASEMSGSRALGLMSTKIDVIIESASAQAKPALAAAEKVSRAPLGFKPATLLWQEGFLKQFSDPAYYDFATKNLQLAELWARAMNLGGNTMRESDREFALHRLDTAVDLPAYKAVVADIMQFLNTERKSIAEIRHRLRTGDTRLDNEEEHETPGGLPPGVKMERVE